MMHTGLQIENDYYAFVQYNRYGGKINSKFN
jgi:hypothetical protein